MFTGIVEMTGKYAGIRWLGEAGKLLIIPNHTKMDMLWNNLLPGESIAVNGVCLTLENAPESATAPLCFHVMRETFTRSNLGSLASHPVVNLERALSLSSHLGGHIVSGHVDAVAEVISFGVVGSDKELCVALPPSLRPYMVWKGSVCINGVSLTISSLASDSFSVCIIPTTERETNLSLLKPGDLLNLECDLIGKYVAHQLVLAGIIPAFDSKSISMEDLINAGY